MGTSDQSTYQLTLKALPSDVDETRRLARLIKMALRTYGFRLVRVVKEEKENGRQLIPASHRP